MGLQLIGVAGRRASSSASVARRIQTCLHQQRDARRCYSKKDGGDRDDNDDGVVKKKEEDGTAEETIKKTSEPPTEHEEVEADEVEDVTSGFPASVENALVRATVPEDVPELIGVPVDRRPVFPGFYKTFSVHDPKVAAALTKAMKRGRPYVGLFLAKGAGLPKDQEQEGEPGPDRIGSLEEVHRVGTFAQIVNLIPDKENGLTAIVFPHRRIRAVELLNPEEPAEASRVRVENVPVPKHNRHSPAVRALMQEVFVGLTEVAKLNPFFREHITHHNVPAAIFEEPSKLADFVAVLTSSPAAELQSVLETAQVEERLGKALVLLRQELLAAELQQSIRKDVEAKMGKRQREYLLHEQLKSIKKELGLETDTKEKLAETFRSRATQLTMPPAVSRVFEEEMGKLAVLEPAGSEFNVTRNYLDWLTQLPWGRTTKDAFDLAAARAILDADHYGLEDVKERILEFMAVGRLRGTVQGKILCLVGPPGVGKTSVGRSVARALGREYFRFPVGGLMDVAEIKGHRRTYVGAMPGKVVQALKQVKTCNPLILLDEIDKLGRGGHQGDPSSALLELLDPEQNGAFLDHYLDVPLDLSSVLFVCTANTLDTIPAPLLDRMEVIRLAGYASQEKLQIAQQYLVPTARTAAGIKAEQVEVTEAALERLVREYCRESGVRGLRQHIEKVFRKAALHLVSAASEPTESETAEKTMQIAKSEQMEKTSEPIEKTSSEHKIVIGPDSLKAYVGSPVFASERMYEGTLLPPGVVTGLAWTSMGGSILYMETVLERVDKKPSFVRTGQLGKVMEESASLAYSYAKSFLTRHQPHNDFFTHAALHLHVPEGATPKDGPSAGVTMATALLSLATGRPVPASLAMTGELSLTGRVLRIGGVKEKVLAAKRAEISEVILPKANQADWDDLPDFVREGVTPHFVEDFEQIASILRLIQ